MKIPWRFRLSLFGLLILTTGIAIAIAMWSRSARRQQALVDGILASGGNVAFDWQIDQTTNAFDVNATSPYPSWLIDLCGQHYFHSIHFAQIKLSKEQTVDLSFLKYGDSLEELDLLRGNPSGRLESAYLPNMRRIGVFVTGTLDVSFLARFASLESVEIQADNIVGLGDLSRLGRLKRLILSTNHLDPPDLGRLEQLSELYLVTLDKNYDPPLTKSQVQEIRELLPKCNVGTDPTME